MSYGLMIDYQYCSGCRTCELACRNEMEFAADEWGIKVLEIGPQQLSNGNWEWDYIPVPTSLCNLCGDRVGRGEKPACVHHCQASVIEFAPVAELAERMAEKGKKVTMFIP